MKNFLFVLAAFILSVSMSMAQGIKEPDFIGEVVVVNPDSTTTKLASEKISIKSKSGLGGMVPLVGSIKSYLQVKGNTSNVKISSRNNPIQIIVKSDANEIDPTSIIIITKFEVTKKERRAYMGKTSLLGGSDVAMPESLPFKGEKFGESSYKLTVSLEPGEYGIMIGSGKESSSASLFNFRCFTVE